MSSIAPTFDLQCHSHHSDGVQVLALTDHDTVDGVAEALEAAPGRGVTIIPAVEISAVHAGLEDFHMLGYLIDHDEPLLAERLRSAREDRTDRIKLMGAALVEDGWRIFDAPIARRSLEGLSVGRPHLAAGVLAHRRNAKRLAAEGIDDVGSFIAAYLIPGTVGYVPRTRPTAIEAIGWVHDAGGIAIWAHPFWDMPDPIAVRTTVECLVDAGLDGVEAFYPTHTQEETAMLVRAATELDLLATGSSDFHGPEHRMFSSFRAFSTHGLEPRLGDLLGSG